VEKGFKKYYNRKIVAIEVAKLYFKFLRNVFKYCETQSPNEGLKL